MYLVTVESDYDGCWFDDPYGFNTRREAQEYGRAISPPSGYSVVIYSCHFEERYSPDVKESTSPEGSPA